MAPLLVAMSAMLLIDGCQEPVLLPPIIKPDPARNILSLEVEDTTCTEVYLTVMVHDSTGEKHNVTLWRDSSIVVQFSAFSGDTLFIDEGLDPNQSYIYTAVIEGVDTASTQTVTMPLTSHDFIWETFTFGGDAGSCVFNDAAIINDTLAYAVGAVYIKDTTHVNGSRFYNAAKWNGVEWELMTVWYYWYDDFGKYDSSTSELRCIYAYSPDRIWFGWSNVTFWNGQRFLSAETNLGGLANKMWGAGTANIYIVGTNGAISHYNGFTWTPIASGTGLHFYDIWGDQNKKTGEWEILAVASNSYEVPSGRIILRILNNYTVEPVNVNGSSEQLDGLWFTKGRCYSRYYSSGSGLYETGDASNDEWVQVLPPMYYLEAIRGNSINDIMVAGHFYSLIHFNGMNWQEYPTSTGGKYFAVAVKGNTVIAVGREGVLPALITVGKRY